MLSWFKQTWIYSTFKQIWAFSEQIVFLRRSYVKIFSFYSYSKLDSPHCGPHLPTGTMIWKNLNLHFLWMLPHKFELFCLNAFWEKPPPPFGPPPYPGDYCFNKLISTVRILAYLVKRRFLKINSIYSYVKSRLPILAPS